jgi:hypothetical protein
MDAGGAGHLGDAGDGHFDIGRGDEHEVGEFIDDDDDVAESVGDDHVIVLGHHDFFVDFDGEAVGTGLDFLLGPEWELGLAGGNGLCLGRSLKDLMLRTPTRAKIW